ncbi:MAG: hypothetical protein WC648_01240 [Candidatus Paceibacterota bacterium]|jgi:hypothetical protein
MSIQFNQTTSPYKGLVQFYEKEIGVNYGDVSGNAEMLGEFTARVSVALDNYLLIWAKNANTWQGDDINHSDFQIITTNIVSGQRDYPFTSDQNSNRIIDVSKVIILPSAIATDYTEITPVDELKVSASEILVNTNTGIPRQYGKMSNAILLDAIPNYNATNGIKMVINREGSYPTTSDTTKIIGVPVYHEYFYKKPAFEKAKILGLANMSQLEKDVIDLEGSERLRINGRIADFFGRRERDVRKRFIPNIESCR